MTPEHVRQTAVEMAQEKGLENLSRSTLCQKAGIPAGSFAHIMGKSFTAFVQELADAGHGGGSGTITKTRIPRGLRRKSIVAAAVRLVERHGEDYLTRDRVAEEARVSASTVSSYFNTMPQLRRAIARAIRNQ